jgi:hypothetical protein
MRFSRKSKNWSSKNSTPCHPDLCHPMLRESEAATQSKDPYKLIGRRQLRFLGKRLLTIPHHRNGDTASCRSPSTRLIVRKRTIKLLRMTAAKDGVVFRSRKNPRDSRRGTSFRKIVRPSQTASSTQCYTHEVPFSSLDSPTISSHPQVRVQCRASCVRAVIS